jgi:hypothetical protein
VPCVAQVADTAANAEHTRDRVSLGQMDVSHINHSRLFLRTMQLCNPEGDRAAINCLVVCTLRCKLASHCYYYGSVFRILDKLSLM